MILKTNTATRIPVGPLVDPGDFKTAETSLTVTNLSVQIYQVKTDGTAVVRTQFAPTASGGNNDMALVTDSTDGMYDLELTAAQLNWLGNGRITFYDVDGFIVHWIDIQVVSAAYFDWIFGTTIPDVNVTKVNGTSQTAKDLGASITHIKAKTDTITTPPAASAIADAVLEESLADHKAVADSLAKALFETNQRLNGAKVVVDADNGTIKVYDTNGTDLLFTLTKTATGNVYTIARS